ncbi:MAG: ribosome small subunit-dependent GTPase A [Candidatus Eisenbacteria bacterium]|nr:ribosome small subunit-dependent GTPase A [Candidatus Eisenbacteria bacterium]
MSREHETAPATHEAVVARVDFGGCVLLADDGALLEATVRGRLMGPRKSLGNAVVVGDRVAFGIEHGRVVIGGVRPRRNAFSRRASGERPEEQVVAANLDQVVLVASLADPGFVPGLADRVLAQAEHAGVPARLVLNKLDLGKAAEAEAILADYARAGTPGHAVSAKSRVGLEPLRHALLGRRSLFVGHSGVGKSTLLNALVPALDLLVGQVNAKTGKGRHTTTAAWLVRPDPGFELIDTPGIRSFGPWGIGPRDLEQAYTEFRRFLGRCRFTDCRHDREPGCALRAAAEAGEVAPRRVASFLKLREELEQEEAHQETRARRGRR